METNNAKFLENGISSGNHDERELVPLPKEDQSNTLEISSITISQRVEDQSTKYTPLHKRAIDIDTTSKSMMNSTLTVLQKS